MDVISISDKSSSNRSRVKDGAVKLESISAISISSESTLRCPVSTYKQTGLKPKLSLFTSPENKTPSVSCKVNTWFDKCQNMKKAVKEGKDAKLQGSIKNIASRYFIPLKDNANLHVENDIEEPRGTILIRYNYKTNLEETDKSSISSGNSMPSKNSTVIICDSLNSGKSRTSEKIVVQRPQSRNHVIIQSPQGKSSEEFVQSTQLRTPEKNVVHSPQSRSAEKSVSHTPQSRNSEKSLVKTPQPKKHDAQEAQTQKVIVETLPGRTPDKNAAQNTSHMRKRKISEHATPPRIEHRKKERSLPPSAFYQNKVKVEKGSETEPKILAPLSPESRKKNDFCAYLQLMNLSSKNFKESNTTKNRHSTRQKTPCNYSDQLNSKGENSTLVRKHKLKQLHNGELPESKTEATRKSFKELKIHLEVMPDCANQPHEEPDTCYFYKSKEMTKNIDFETAIVEFFKENRINYEKNRLKIPNNRRFYSKSMDCLDSKSRASSEKENVQNVSGNQKRVTNNRSREKSTDRAVETARGEMQKPKISLNVKNTENKPKMDATSSIRKKDEKVLPALKSKNESGSDKRVATDVSSHNNGSIVNAKNKSQKSLQIDVQVLSKTATKSPRKKSQSKSLLCTSTRRSRRRHTRHKILDSTSQKSRKQRLKLLKQKKADILRKKMETDKFKATPKPKKGEIRILNTSGKSSEPSLELTPILKGLKQPECFKKLAPEHFKALVETKKFLNPKPDANLQSPLSEVHTIVEKVQLKKPVENIKRDAVAEIVEIKDVVKVEEVVESKKCDLNGQKQDLEDESSGYVPCDSSSQSENDHSYHIPNGDHGDYTLVAMNGTKKTSAFAKQAETVNTDEISSTNCEYIPLSTNVEVKTLHKSLVQTKRKMANGLDSDEYSNHEWETDSPSSQRMRGASHRNSFSIQIMEEHGEILNAFYIDFNLVIAQEKMVSFWNQTALGSVLGSQDMWLSKGCIQRLVLDHECSQKTSQEMMVSTDTCFAYIELWTKEHKSFNRERPVADVFAAVYYWKNTGIDKKVLQLENIKGYAEDVQYIVLRNSRSIIVSWNTIMDDDKMTKIHLYNLASDYKSIVNIKELASVDHYVSSLHNIEDCDTIIMGTGEHRVTLWNLEYGYIVATIDLMEDKPVPRTLWVKCDRGFLFSLQLFEDNLLRLIAINGISHKWKKLQIYRASEKHENLRGACMENGILTAFYESGVCCWNVEHGECLVDELLTDTVFTPSSKHVLVTSEDEIHVHNALSYILTFYDP